MTSNLMRALIIFIFVTLTCGCATFSTMEKLSLSNSLEHDQFVPIKLAMHEGDRYSVDFGYRLKRIENSLKESGQFLQVGRNINSPFVFVMHLDHKDSNSAGETAMSFVSAATLGLIPATYKGQHTLKTNVFFQGHHIATYEHQSSYEMKWSIYNYGETIDWDDSPEFVSIHNAVMALISDLVRAGIIPTVKETLHGNTAAEQQV